MSRHRIGTALVVLGGLAWVPYFALKALPDVDPPFYPFLTVHLLGVIPGFLLGGEGIVRILWKKLVR